MKVGGLVLGRQRPATASGVTFITLEDETGVMNLIVQSNTYEKYYTVAKFSKLMLAQGTVERQGDVVHVLVKKMSALSIPHLEALSAPSRDFR